MDQQPNQQQGNTKSAHALREEKILSFWKEKNIFNKSLEKPSPKGDFVFYDGPPFATGLPHYGHILPGTIKDVIPRWKTMQGYRVRRRWGWDTHGLPVENLIEKELGLKSKKDILDYGIGKFNAAAKDSVMRFADEWRTIVPRLGRWVDMENDYRTMDASYTETVWWIFKRLYEKGLIYEGFKSMSLCPRCETTLSNFEVAQGYKDITDISVTAKFKLKSGQKIRGINVGDDSYVLAWTTTPWTLPGNVALAVGKDIDYVIVKIEGKEYVLAKARLGMLKDQAHEVISEFKGSDIVGLIYEPLFAYYSNDKTIKNRENGWKIYGADFVTTEDGTGIVHIAPAFGADDYDLLLKNNLPFVQHVTTDGHFKPEAADFAGLPVKPKDSDNEKDVHQKTDIEIIKWLAHHDQLFAKEKLVHSYPHCWRCETPLLNYATSSWFVKVTDIKDKLVSENKKVTWVPPEIGAGRFGNWLEGARDWAISRSRFWGAPIPVWKDVKNNSYHVIGSVSDLRSYAKPRNKYHVMRHGEAACNVREVLNSDINLQNHLTAHGKDKVTKAAAKLKGTGIDLIIVSPFIRTQETAHIVKEALGLADSQMITDDRLREIAFGEWDGMTLDQLLKVFPLNENRFVLRPNGGENHADVKVRVGEFLYDIDSKYEGKNILIVTHGSPAMMLIAAARGWNRSETADYEKNHYIEKAGVRALDFTPLPHNEEYELDFHRPYIDQIKLHTKEGNELVRVPDVFDCWFESGAMPYGEAHYPFCNEGGKKVFEPKSGLFGKSKGFPADFISEGLDQTRGWFYSMMVLGVALFGKSPYKKVVVNGLVLAEDGQKMSKSKHNYPDPMLIVDKFGADPLRYYLMSSPAVHAQDLCFSEKGVDEITKKIVNRLLNVVSFYEMYKDKSGAKPLKENPESKNILDQWIVSRLDEVIATVTNGLEAGEIDRAVRPINDFVDDLSTWYLRRSRDRFKGDDSADRVNALNTTQYVLIEISKIIAPIMPFLAEDIYQRIPGSLESVHLESWPEIKLDKRLGKSKMAKGSKDENLIAEMAIVRGLSSSGLEARTMAKINVRQPLKKLKVKSQLSIFSGTLSAELIDLVKDEVNVKEVVVDPTIQNDVELDVNITQSLKEEGEFRELLRKVQDMRKEKGLSVGDRASLMIPPEFYTITQKYGDEIKKLAGIDAIESGEEFVLKSS